MTTLTDREIFQRAFEKVRNPETWCQGAYAKNAIGDYLDNGFVAGACKWCSIGAIEYGACDFMGGKEVFEQLKAAVPGQFLSDFNDTHTHAEVVALWEKVGRENGWLEEAAGVAP